MIKAGFRVGLKPWEVQRLTPAEFELACEAYQEAQEEWMYRLGWHAACVCSPWSKKKVKNFYKPKRRSGGRKVIDVLGMSPEQVSMQVKMLKAEGQ